MFKKKRNQLKSKVEPVRGFVEMIRRIREEATSIESS